MNKELKKTAIFAGTALVVLGLDVAFRLLEQCLA